MKQSFFTTVSLVGMMLFLPAIAHAHVKWFVDASTVPPQQLEIFSLTHPAMVTAIAIAAIVLLAAFGIEIKMKSNHRGVTRKRWNSRLLRIFQILIGAWLLINTYLGIVFVPTFEAVTTVHMVLLALQAMTGLFMLIGLLPALASLLLLVVYAGAAWQFGVLNAVEHIHIVGIALAYAFITSTPDEFLHRYAYGAVPALRIATGVSLIALGLQEKLLYPELGIVFLQDHNWNFMTMLGFEWFTDAHFVLAAGLTELMIGVLYVLGLITRINTVIFAVVLVTTAIIMGPLELVGHLPIIAIAIVFLAYGNGARCTVARLIKRWR